LGGEGLSSVSCHSDREIEENRKSEKIKGREGGTGRGRKKVMPFKLIQRSDIL